MIKLLIQQGNIQSTCYFLIILSTQNYENQLVCSKNSPGVKGLGTPTTAAAARPGGDGGGQPPPAEALLQMARRWRRVTFSSEEDEGGDGGTSGDGGASGEREDDGGERRLRSLTERNNERERGMMRER